MSDINGKSRPAEENDFCRIEITIDRTTGKRTINISTEEDITDFDIEDTEGWSFEQLDAKYDELQAALEELEDDPPPPPPPLTRPTPQPRVMSVSWARRCV